MADVSSRACARLAPVPLDAGPGHARGAEGGPGRTDPDHAIPLLQANTGELK